MNTSRVALKTTSKRSPRSSSAPCFVLGLRQAQDAVLDDDQRAIDDEPEVERPKAHEIAADLLLDHAGEGGEQRQRNDECGQQRRTQIAEKHEQHDDHEQRTFEEILLHRRDRLVDEYRAVVDRIGFDPGWQSLVDLRQRSATRSDTVRLFSPMSINAVPSTVSSPSSVAAPVRSSLPIPTCGNIADGHRHIVTSGDHGAAQRVGISDLPRHAHELLLAVGLDVAGADIQVVRFEGLHQIAQRHAKREEARRIGRHLILLGVAADAVDLGNTWHLTQLRTDDPVLNAAQIGRSIGGAVRLSRTGLGDDAVEVDLAEAGGHRPHRRGHAGGQLTLHFLQALIHELTREIDVGAVAEKPPSPARARRPTSSECSQVSACPPSPSRRET